MKLSIIPSDGTVCENGKCYTHLHWEGTPADVHALQWDHSAGWIEYTNKPNEDITSLPQWALNAAEAWYIADNPPAPEPPGPPTAEQNAATAKQMLVETDWVELPSVSDPNTVPHLLNKAAFITYRDEVRPYVVYPIPGVVNWPTKPVEQWSDPFEFPT